MPTPIPVREWRFREKYLDSMPKYPWPSGVWDDEPDKIQFPDPATNLPCLIVRNRIGALCGYVGVTRSHPLFGIGYNDCSRIPVCVDEDGEWAYCDHMPSSLLSVHGGLTFSGFCDPDEPLEGICHIVDPDVPDDEPVFWFGFDTAHANDLPPGMLALDQFLRDQEPDKFPLRSDLPAPFTRTYKPVAYVKAECADLAGQLFAIKKGD